MKTTAVIRMRGSAHMSPQAPTLARQKPTQATRQQEAEPAMRGPAMEKLETAGECTAQGELTLNQELLSDFRPIFLIRYSQKKGEVLKTPTNQYNCTQIPGREYSSYHI